MVPRLAHRRCRAFRRCAMRTGACGLDGVPTSGVATSHFCSTPAAPPAWPRARSCRTATWSPTSNLVAAWIARDLVDGEETAVIPLPLYHVYALTSNLVFMKIGAPRPADHHTPRPDRLHRRTQAHPLHRDDRRQPRFTTPSSEQRASAQGRPERAAVFRRRHGRAARGGGALEARTGVPLVEASAHRDLAGFVSTPSTSATGPAPSACRSLH